MHACFFIHSLGGYALSFPFLLSLHEEGLKNYGKIHTNLTTVTIFFFAFFFLLFRAAPVAHGNSQARDRIGAAAPSLHHSHGNVGSEPCLQPAPQLMAMPTE